MQKEQQSGQCRPPARAKIPISLLLCAQREKIEGSTGGTERLITRPKKHHKIRVAI